MSENAIDKEIDVFLDCAPTLDVAARRVRLARLRALFATGKMSVASTKALVARRHELLGETVFVRSSTTRKISRASPVRGSIPPCPTCSPTPR